MQMMATGTVVMIVKCNYTSVMLTQGPLSFLCTCCLSSTAQRQSMSSSCGYCSTPSCPACSALYCCTRPVTCLTDSMPGMTCIRSSALPVAVPCWYRYNFLGYTSLTSRHELSSAVFQQSSIARYRQQYTILVSCWCQLDSNHFFSAWRPA